MPNKDLLVLAECIDSRNGRRFGRGAYFEPVPTTDQATRLFRAGCLPEGAIKLAQAEDSKLAEKAEREARVAEKLAERQATIAAAVDADARAKIVLDAARTELSEASSDTEKSAAAKKVAEAEAVAAKASEDLAKAQK